MDTLSPRPSPKTQSMELCCTVGVQAPAALSSNTRVLVARRPHRTSHKRRSWCRSSSDPRMVCWCLRRATGRPRSAWSEDGQGEVCGRPVYHDGGRLHSYYGAWYSRRHISLPGSKFLKNVRYHCRRPLNERRRRKETSSTRMPKLMGPLHPRHRRNGHDPWWQPRSRPSPSRRRNPGHHRPGRNHQQNHRHRTKVSLRTNRSHSHHPPLRKRSRPVRYARKLLPGLQIQRMGTTRSATSSRIRTGRIGRPLYHYFPSGRPWKGRKSYHSHFRNQYQSPRTPRNHPSRSEPPCRREIQIPYYQVHEVGRFCAGAKCQKCGDDSALFDGEVWRWD